MKKIFLAMMLCVCAVGAWAQETTYVTTIINTDSLKSRHLEYFDLSEEEWQAFEQRGYQYYLDYEFLDDTLHVTGIQPINCYDYLIACTIHEENIRVSIYALYDPEEEQPDCMVPRWVEAKIPGFNKGTYQVSFENETPIQVPCGGSDYRPFIEDGKVWTVSRSLPGQEQYLSYYYFDGDTIVGEKPCKRMMCLYGNEQGDDVTAQVGAFYEEGKRVYCAFPGRERFLLLYDFETAIGDTIEVYAGALAQLAESIEPAEPTTLCTIVGKGTGEPDSFKGRYTQVVAEPQAFDFENFDTWMEGVGGYQAPTENVLYHWVGGNKNRLMLCTVGDEVLFRHPEWEDNTGAESKKRIDFTHVIKTKPKSPHRKVEAIETAESLSAIYDSSVLSLDLGTLSQSYVVTITDNSGQTAYSKEVKAQQVLALNIDISPYTGTEYSVTLENSQEVFTGHFNLSEAAAIHDIPTPQQTTDILYDLTGRLVTTHPRKGIYIQNGKKMLVR